MTRHGCSVVFRQLGAWGAVLCVSMPFAADAQPSDGAAMAEALFRQAKQSLAEGRVEEACTQFEASLRLDYALGALLNLAYCHETQGQLASAWAEYRDAEALARRTGHSERERFALQQAEALEPKLDRLRVTLENPVPSMTIEIDGTPLPPGGWGVPFPVDAGAHTVVATAPGHNSWTSAVRVAADSGTVSITIPRLTPKPPAPAQEPEPPDRTIAYAVGAGGIAALGVGSYFGILTFQRKAEGDEHCRGRLCDSTGLAYHDQAEQSATISTVAIGTGIAALALAGWLVLDQPSSESGFAVRRGAGTTSLEFVW